VEWVAQTLLTHPEIAVLLAVGLGAALGRLRYRSISLGAVTGTLIAGVLLGALVRIENPDGTVASLTVEGPAKNLFFLLFLFALGIRLGPQFVAGLKGSGAPQALFAAILAVVGFTTVFIVAKVLDLNPGLAAGVAGGGLTQSAIVGVAQGSIAGLPQDAATLKEWSDLVPVAYAVTYLFGTIGTALYCANVAPRMLGITDLPKAAAALERRVGLAQTPPDVHSAYLDVTRRAYHLTNLPTGVSTAGELEQHLAEACGQDHHVYVARIRTADGLQDATPDSTLTAGSTVVLTARRIDLFAPDLAHFAEEVNDYELLGFAIEDLWVVVAPHGAAGRTVGDLRADKHFRRIYLRGLRRSGHDLPLADSVVLRAGDEVRMQGPLPLLEGVIPRVGHAERSGVESSLVLLGLGIAAGALTGAPSLRWRFQMDRQCTSGPHRAIAMRARPLRSTMSSARPGGPGHPDWLQGLAPESADQ
jgi:putative transport protein